MDLLKGAQQHKKLTVIHDGNCSDYSAYAIENFVKDCISLQNNSPDNLDVKDFSINIFDETVRKKAVKVAEKELHDRQILEQMGINTITKELH